MPEVVVDESSFSSAMSPNKTFQSGNMSRNFAKGRVILQLSPPKQREVTSVITQLESTEDPKEETRVKTAVET
jgi:hypothetical protein